ncbi:MAG: sugar ABC transporter permease [Candidatus Poseidoniales archaeon]|nr:sugar ABC transporter permease [Candidatus Poseidoniales archaeon]RJV00291.1 MAG: sugar ABC transporter permease [Candidatus Poseidoniales archaeon]
MSGERVMRDWYAPLEIYTLHSWLRVALVVNIMLLIFDVLRDDGLDLSLAGILSLALLIKSLPDGTKSWRRDLSLGLSGVIILIGTLSVMSQPIGFVIWMESWLIIPGAISLYWISSPHVTKWNREEMEIGRIEKGLARNNQFSSSYQRVGKHIILAHFAFIVLLPVAWIVDIALSPGNALGGSFGDSFTTEHFSKILGGDQFWIWMTNSLIVSIGTTIAGLALAVPAAYAFSRFKFSGRDQAMFSFLLVQMFPGIIILVPYFMVMKSLGLLNSHMGLILAYSVTALPLCVWMLKGFFDTVPRELEEAAMLDGCSRFEIFAKIILPLSLPAIAVTALFSFLAAWNEFLLALTFNTSNDMYTLPVGLASMISATGQSWGDFAAASLLVSLPVVILFILFQKFLVEGLSAGGVKG